MVTVRPLLLWSKMWLYCHMSLGHTWNCFGLVGGGGPNATIVKSWVVSSSCFLAAHLLLSWSKKKDSQNLLTLSSFVSRTDKYFWIKCSSCYVIFVTVHTVKNIYRKQAFKALALVSKILNLFEIRLYLLWRKVAEIWPNLMLQSLKRT
jgi:hypothetical protein